MQPKYREVKRMTATMRAIHWINALSMIVAVVTGLYIGHPYYQTFMADGAVDKYVMAWNRWGHFMVAIIFDISFFVIFYLYYFSRFDKEYKRILPTPKNIVQFVEVLLNLLTLNRRKKFDSSHADSFNSVYFLVFHLLILWMLLTGLQLYVQGLESGISAIGGWWPWLLHVGTDWTIQATGKTLMDVRISHHLSMWFILIWILFHIYYQVWRTIFWKEGDISIAIGGSKFAKEE